MTIFEWIAAELAARADNPDAQIAWLEREVVEVEALEEKTGISLHRTKMALLWNKVLLLHARQAADRVPA